MSENEKFEKSAGPTRRTMIKGAAWSVPVIAATMAAPASVASENNSTVVWGSDTGALLSLSLFTGETLASAALLSTGPNTFSVINGAGELTGPLTITMTSTYSSGLSLGLGRPHGIGIFAIPGATQTTWVETVPTGDLPLLRKPFTVTSTFSYAGSIASLATALLDVQYRYSEGGSFLSLGAIGSFDLNLSVSAGATLVGADSANLVVPLNVTAG